MTDVCSTMPHAHTVDVLINLHMSVDADHWQWQYVRLSIGNIYTEWKERRKE